MGGFHHHGLERLPAETAHHHIRGRHNIICRRVTPRAPDKIARKQQAHHLGAPIFHGLRQRGDAGHNRAHKLHTVPGPKDGLPRFKAAVILDVLQAIELIRITARTNCSVLNWAVFTTTNKLRKISHCVGNT